MVVDRRPTMQHNMPILCLITWIDDGLDAVSKLHADKVIEIFNHFYIYFT